MKEVKKLMTDRNPPKEVASSHEFSCGDPAVLLYHHKERLVKVLVTISSILYTLGRGAPGQPRPITGRWAYTVRSAHGGELTADPRNLRPGNVLDRISAALED